MQEYEKEERGEERALKLLPPLEGWELEARVSILTRMRCALRVVGRKAGWRGRDASPSPHSFSRAPHYSAPRALLHRSLAAAPPLRIDEDSLVLVALSNYNCSRSRDSQPADRERSSFLSTLCVLLLGKRS